MATFVLPLSTNSIHGHGISTSSSPSIQLSSDASDVSDASNAADTFDAPNGVSKSFDSCDSNDSDDSEYSLNDPGGASCSSLTPLNSFINWSVCGEFKDVPYSFRIGNGVDTGNGVDASDTIIRPTSAWTTGNTWDDEGVEDIGDSWNAQAVCGCNELVAACETFFISINDLNSGDAGNVGVVVAGGTEDSWNVRVVCSSDDSGIFDISFFCSSSWGTGNVVNAWDAWDASDVVDGWDTVDARDTESVGGTEDTAASDTSFSPVWDMEDSWDTRDAWVVGDAWEATDVRNAGDPSEADGVCSDGILISNDRPEVWNVAEVVITGWSDALLISEVGPPISPNVTVAGALAEEVVKASGKDGNRSGNCACSDTTAP